MIMVVVVMVVVMVVVRMRMRMRILNPPATLVGKLEHVFVNVPVLLHNLGVLLGHHVDHNTARLAEASHRGEAEEKSLRASFRQNPPIHLARGMCPAAKPPIMTTQSKVRPSSCVGTSVPNALSIISLYTGLFS